MGLLGRLGRRIKRYANTVRDVGIADAIRYHVRAYQDGVRGQTTSIRLRSPYAAHPLLCRPRASDLHVFRQIFLEREYQCLDAMQGVDLVIDCGANVGYSSAYFLTRFPNAHVIAVEPDPGNYAVLRENMAPYGDRAEVLNAAIWTNALGLTFSEIPYRGGGEWARQVRECREGETPSIATTDIGTLLARSGRARISILKIDIEGAEAKLFAGNHDEWIDRVDALVVELHDDTYFGKVSDRFFEVVRARPFDISRFGELTCCIRRPSPA